MNHNRAPLHGFFFCIWLAMAGTALANPTGESLVAGSAGFDRNSPNTLTVTQQSQNAIVNWQDFSVHAGETTRFVQPNSNANILNRVVGDNVSSIYGSLQGNGNVFLINPHGVVVGPDGVVKTGSFTASTLNTPDGAFMDGGALEFNGASRGPLKNLGTIEATGGDVTLLGQEIQNNGTLKASGDVNLVAASHVILQPTGNSKVAIVADSAAGTMTHSGLIEATNATLVANGGNAEALAIAPTGIVRASGAEESGGHIVLSGGGGDVNVGGTLEARQGSNGGSIDVTGKRVLIADGAELHADGAKGGSVKLGGGKQGKDASLANAERLYIGQTARVTADGSNGDGGRVIAYSSKGTQSYGSLSARGSDKGGFIETSGGWLDLGNKAPDVWGGKLGGTWLIDPYNIEIVAGSGNTGINTSSPFSSTGDTAQLGVGLVTTALASGNVTVQTGSGGSQAGDITLQTNLDFNGIGTNRTLTLSAQRNITLNGTIADGTPGGDSLNIVFNADNDSNGLGASILNKNITTGGGNLTFNSAAYLAGASALTLNVGAGNMTFNNQVQLANTSGVTLSTNGGTIAFNNALDSGNTYAYDSTTRTWNSAFSAVKSGTGANAGDTYLATLTSALENSIAQSTLPATTSAWLGGNDAAVEGTWRWVAGPEGLENSGAGRQFWQGVGNGTPVNGQYSNWVAGTEPNDSGGAEDALQIGFGTAGEWNDYPINTSLLGSVVETNLAPTNLTINTGAGAVTFGGLVGADKQLGNITINSGGTTNINNSINSAGTVDIGGASTWGSAGKTLTANSYVQRGAATTSVADTTIVADDMDIQSAFTNNNASGVLGLRQRTNGVAVNLGAVGDGTASTLELSAAEMGRLNVLNVRVGSGNAGNLTLSTDMTLTGLTNLTLATGGTLTDGSGNRLSVTGLALSALGSVTFDSDHDVDNLAIYSPNGAAVFHDVDGFNIGNVDGIVGIGASGRNVQLSAGGAVTQNQDITAAGLELLGTNAAYTLTRTGNNIATLAANTGSVNYVDSNAVAVGTVNTAGITTTGAAQVRTVTGNLTVDQGVTAGGSGNSIVMAAGSGFVNNAGANSLNVGSGGGRYLIYTNTFGGTTLGGLAGTPRQYNKTYGGNAPGTIGGTGSQVLYSYAPTLTFTADTLTQTYGALNLTYSVSGLESGDTAATAFAGAPDLTPASQNVGSRAVAITTGGLSNLQGYTFAFVNGNVTINPAALIITADSLSKEYGHANPTLTATYTGLANGDTAAAISGLNLATTADVNSQPGTYAITAIGGTNSNYTITRVDGTLTVRPFAQANEVKEELVTFSNVPTKQQTVEVPTVEPAAGAATPGNSPAAVSSRNFVLPQVGVLPAPTQGGNNGQANAEGGSGPAMAHASTLDLIEEETK